MDNLARVQDEGGEPARKPSLFVVKEPAAPSTAFSSPRGSRRNLIVWGAAALAIAVLGASYFVSSGLNQRPPVVEPVTSPFASVQLIREGNFKGALPELDRQLAKSPGLRSALVNRAYVLKQIGRYQEAELAYKALLERYPHDSTVRNNLGALYLKTGRFDQAEPLLRDAAEGGNEQAQLNLGQLKEKQKDWPGALKVFEAMLERKDAHPQQLLIRERVRRLRSLAASASSRKESF